MYSQSTLLNNNYVSNCKIVYFITLRGREKKLQSARSSYRTVTGNKATQWIALFTENISGNSATRCYILDNYSIITKRRYIKLGNHTYFFTRNILVQILFLSDLRFLRYLTIDKITLLTTHIPHFVNCQISTEP